ncbi:MAG TPA: DUF202 domain-containing protein [Mycobacteriales bacterium]|nr:DUF202 domain-containing protein [Mycobacteriales bacterium]
MSPADPPPTVPAERTVLAWVRTALAYGVCALLCARLVAGSTSLALAVVLLGALATTAVAGIASSRYRRARADAAAGRPVAAPLATATAAALTALLGLAAAVLVVVR